MAMVVSCSKKIIMKVKIIIPQLVLGIIILMLINQGDHDNKFIKAELQRFEHELTKADNEVRFLVVGDWGRKDAFNQSLVATQQQETGGEVTAVQLFMLTHQKKDKTWIDNKSSEAYEKFTTKWNEIQTSHMILKLRVIMLLPSCPRLICG